MRALHAHSILPDEALKIHATDEPGAGGANHRYQITGFNTATNPSDPFVERHGQPAEHATILFQNGTVPEVGANGITVEALIAVSMDRLQAFQAGPFACKENGDALYNLSMALGALHSRTEARLRRNVEGKHIT